MTDDLTQRDLSRIADEDLSPEERREVKRRFDDFVARLREKKGIFKAKRAKPKRISRWDPEALSRKH